MTKRNETSETEGYTPEEKFQMLKNVLRIPDDLPCETRVMHEETFFISMDLDTAHRYLQSLIGDDELDALKRDLDDNNQYAVLRYTKVIERLLPSIMVTLSKSEQHPEKISVGQHGRGISFCFDGSDSDLDNLLGEEVNLDIQPEASKRTIEEVVSIVRKQMKEETDQPSAGDSLGGALMSDRIADLQDEMMNGRPWNDL
jgi:hypothetical protein